MRSAKPAACPACGYVPAPDALFCSQCGTRLRGSDDAPRAAAPRRERKIVSVLFADMKGSTELVAKEDPERASERLEQLLQQMGAAVHRFGGTVSRVQGDGIMALFGAPIEYEDHAIRACAAALDMLEAVSREVAVEIRVGIASGEVVTLPVRSGTAVYYDALGAVVHIAARLEQAAQPSTALISEATQDATRATFETRRRELSGLRGLPAIVTAFELVGWSARGEGRSRTRTRTSGTSFVDRVSQIAALRASLSGLADGRGRVGCVTGEPGTGKSALIREFLRRTFQDVTTCVIRCSPYRPLAYGPLAELVAGFVGADAAMTVAQRREHLDRTIRELVFPDAPDVPALRMLLDAGAEDPMLRALPPPDRRQRVEAAGIALLAGATRRRPLALVIEDVHQLDDDGRNQISRICEHLRPEGCLVMLSVQTESELGPTLRRQCDAVCHTGPLGRTHAGEMVRTLLRPGRGAAALERTLVELTRGNPLFIREAIHALHQSGALSREGDAYTLRRPEAEVPLPPTVRGLLAARIDRLMDPEKDTLQAVATMGQAASSRLLRDFLGIDAATLDSRIALLVEAGLLSSSPSDDSQRETVLRFRHPLVREVVYEETLLRDRVRIHRWTLARLEELHRCGQFDRMDVLAGHAMRGEAWEKAAGYLVEAGQQAFGRDAKSEAVRLLLQGLEATSHLPAGEASATVELRLRLELRNSLFQLGRVPELAAHLDAARPTALALGHVSHTGRYHIYQSHLHWFSGNSRGALAEAAAAQALAESNGATALGVRARFQQGLVAFSEARYRDTIAMMDTVSGWLEREPAEHTFGLNKSLLITTLGYGARAHAELGEQAAARAVSARSLAAARDLDNQFAWVFAYIAEAWASLRANDPERAVPFLEQAHVICAGEDAPLMGPAAASFLALALLEIAAQPHAAASAVNERALTLARQSVSQAEECGFRAFQPLRIAILSRSLVAVGRAEEAMQHAVEAYDSARRQGEGLAEIEALRALSVARRELNQDWREPLESACRLARSFGMGPILAQCDALLHPRHG